MQYTEEALAALLDAFKERQPLYREYGARIELLLREHLSRSAVRDYTISSREKSLDGFTKKIQRKNYAQPLSDITDLTGVRVTVCYLDQITRVEDILFAEFEIDQQNSIDRSKIYAADTFGYLSDHKIVSNSKPKTTDSDWSKFNGIKAEVQLRTTLQHAWALVNHALYKNESELPKNLWRRLNRLAGVFELADQEFMEIRQQNEKYKTDIVKQFDEDRTDHIEINYFTLTQYLTRSQVAISAAKAARDHRILFDDSLQIEYYNRMDSASVADICKLLGINTIADLAQLLEKYKRSDAEFLSAISKRRTWQFTKPFILFLLLLKARHADFPKTYLQGRYGWDQKATDLVFGEATRLGP